MTGEYLLIIMLLGGHGDAVTTQVMPSYSVCQETSQRVKSMKRLYSSIETECVPMDQEQELKNLTEVETMLNLQKKITQQTR